MICLAINATMLHGHSIDTLDCVTENFQNYTLNVPYIYYYIFNRINFFDDPMILILTN